MINVNFDTCEAATNDSGAMEAGDHLKTGRVRKVIQAENAVR